MKTLVVTANDKLGRAMLERLPQRPDIVTAFDVSQTLPRVIRLIRRGTLSPLLVARMAWAEWRRPRQHTSAAHRIKNNRDLMTLIDRGSIERVLLYRVGLIITPDAFNGDIEILNIHCARLPEFGGIGAIHRAIEARAWNQNACAHRVTGSIDAGEVIARESYRLSPNRAYQGNEDDAYEAGMRLLLKLLDGWRD